MWRVILLELGPQVKGFRKAVGGGDKTPLICQGSPWTKPDGKPEVKESSLV